MEQLVLQLWDFLHLLRLLYLHLQQFYRETFLGTTSCRLTVASTSIVEIWNTLTLFLSLRLLWSENIENWPRDMLFVEIYLIWLSKLFAHAGSHSKCHWFRWWLIFRFGIDLLSEIDKFELELIENIELLLIEKVFVIGDPHIVKLYVVEVV